MIKAIISKKGYLKMSLIWTIKLEYAKNVVEMLNKNC